MDEQLEIPMNGCSLTGSDASNNNNNNDKENQEVVYAPLTEGQRKMWKLGNIKAGARITPERLDEIARTWQAKCDRYHDRENDSIYPPNWPYPAVSHDVTLSSHDPVKYPSHYSLFEGTQQVIDLIKDRLTPAEYKGYLKGNMIKYHMRAERKNGLEDYKKMQMYLQWLIINEEDSTDV